VAEDRLTRQELGWLLTEQARGTARALRDGVTQLRGNSEHPLDRPPQVESMLDALDGTIELLGELELSPAHGQPVPKDRRARVDLAALLVEVTPDSRIAIEPGQGTEVLAVDSDVRRMLGVLVGYPSVGTGAGPSGIRVRREADWVRVSVELGPEGAATRQLEQRWLNRMAIRYGGRVELEGRQLALVLPAYTSNEQRELRQLRDELEQAQQLGAVYARELAEAFATTGDSPSSVPSAPRRSDERLEVIMAVAVSLGRTLKLLADSLRADAARIARHLGDGHEATVEISRRLTGLAELVKELDRIARISTNESRQKIDLAELLASVVGQAGNYAARHEVGLKLLAAAEVRAKVRVSVLSLLLRCIIDLAIAATPRGGQVVVGLAESAGGVDIFVEDGGPVIPESAQSALLRGSADPSAVGRPGGIGWLTAGAAAQSLDATLTVGESADRRAQVHILLTTAS